MNRCYLLFLGVSLWGLSACQLPVISGKADFFEHRNQRVAILTFKAADQVSEPVWENLRQLTLQRLQEHPEVQAAFFAQDDPAAQVADSDLPVRLQRFTTTLALTGIAERDLGSPIQQELGANLLFLLQLEDYPCSKDCPGQQQFLLRLKLYDFRNGELLYQARLNYQLDETEQEPEALANLVTDWSGRLLNRWAADFRTPWHRWRYENLRALALQPAASR